MNSDYPDENIQKLNLQLSKQDANVTLLKNYIAE